jgi:hypothetical protein
VNFALNVVNFAPDYVIFMEAWNDSRARRAVKGFRSDYSHAFKVFEPPRFIADRYLVRWSVAYRMLLPQVPYWAHVESSALKDRKLSERFDNVDELRPYRRNVKSIVLLARGHGAAVVLATMPRTTDPNQAHFFLADHIDQSNEVMRDLAGELGKDVTFVDLDREITGKHEVFVDVAHTNEEGKRMVAGRIADAILEHRRSARGACDPNSRNGGR